MKGNGFAWSKDGQLLFCPGGTETVRMGLPSGFYWRDNELAMISEDLSGNRRVEPVAYIVDMRLFVDFLRRIEKPT